MRLHADRWLSRLGLALGLLLAAGATLAAAGAGLDGGLRAALEGAGWEVIPRPDGRLELRLPGEAPRQTEGHQPQRSSVGEEERAREEVAWERLTEQGWRVERVADGSILLYPPRPAVQPLPPTAPEMAPAGAASHGPLSAGFEDQARARGWRVERVEDGSLLLYPRRD